MIRFPRWIAALLGAAVLIAPSADAQRKKPPPRKKPAATAKHKHRLKRPAAPKSAASAPAPKPTAESDTSEIDEAEPSLSKAEESEEEPMPGDDERVDTEKDNRRSGESPLPPLLDIEAGVMALQRHLVYQDDVNNVLPDYNLGGAPALGVNVGFYPLRTSSLAVGLVGGFETAFAIGSAYEDPRPGQEGTRSGSASAFSIGGRANYTFAKSFLGVGVDYGVQGYTVDLPPPTPNNAQVPNTSYAFVRPNAAARIGIAREFSLLANIGYLVVLSAGDLVSDARFVAARSSVSGFDLGAGLAWAPFGGTFQNLEFRPMVAWRRFSFAFKPERTDPFQATGAHDDFVTLSLLMGLRI